MKAVGNTALSLTTPSDLSELPPNAAAQVLARLNLIEIAINSFITPNCD